MQTKKELLSVNEQLFILDALRQNIRVDGRKLYDMRTLEISFGHSRGHAEVSLGNTR